MGVLGVWWRRTEIKSLPQPAEGELRVKQACCKQVPAENCIGMFVLSCHPLAESGGVFVLWESPGKGGEVWAGSR